MRGRTEAQDREIKRIERECRKIFDDPVLMEDLKIRAQEALMWSERANERTERAHRSPPNDYLIGAAA